MAYEVKENTASLFANDKKQQGDKQPDFKGKANVNGALKDVAGWWHQAQSGQWYLSLSFAEPYQAQQQSGFPPQPQAGIPQASPAPQAYGNQPGAYGNQPTQPAPAAPAAPSNLPPYAR